METPKLVIICPKDHLPSIPNLPAAACNSPWCCGSKGFGMFSALWAWEATQKSSQIAHCRHCPIAFPKLLWGLPARLHTCSSLPSHISRWAVSSLMWGGHAPVFFSQASKCVHGRSQISPSGACSVPPSQMTTAPPGQGWAPVADRGGLFPHLCAPCSSQNDIKHVLNIITASK